MLHADYNGYLVGVSILIASIASYVALDLAGRVTASSGRSRAAWITGSAVAMGIGIWSMHFVAMLALRTSVPINYDVPLLTLSVVIAIGGSAVTFFMSARERIRTIELALASLFMGPAIAGMHYTGMAAIRMHARISYDPALYRLSILVAIVVSFVALQLAVRLRSRNSTKGQWLKIASACLMGAAVYGMHYTGMTAARFTPDPTVITTGGWSVVGSNYLAATVAVMTMIVLAIAAVGAMADRRFKHRAAEADVLREREERYRLLFESNPMPMWVFDAETFRFLDVNRAAIAHYGYTRDEFLSMTLADVRPPDQMEPLKRAVAESADGLASITDGTHRTRAGTLIHVEKTLHPLRFQERAARLALVNDITRRREAEIALRQTMDLLRAVIDDSPIAIIATDLERRVTRWNPAAEALLGWSAGEMVGKAYTELVPADELPHHADLQTAALRGQAATHVNMKHLHRNGSDVDVSVALAVLRDAEANPNGFVFLVSDETDRKRLESRMRQAERMQAVGQLAGGIAHDFNNLMTAITSYSDFLLQDLEQPDRRRDDVVAIQEAALRAAALTRQLLAFSRQQVRKPQVMSLNPVVESVTEMVRRLLPASITVHLDLAQDLDAVNADPGQMEQVLINLLVNARDAMPDGGDITVRTANLQLNDASRSRGEHGDATAGSYVALTVADTGIGMTPDVQARIFEPFFTTKPPGSGTGLGLATVYGIVKQSEGHVAVETALGRGSVFRIVLPRVASDDMEQGSAPVTVKPEHGCETILLVEDNDMVRAVGKRTLEKFGYSVIEAASGRHALDLYKTHGSTVDLVVTDIVMPEMGGYELERRLRELNPELRVLFMSGYSKEALARPELVPEGSAFLEKPFAPEELASTVREVLDAATVTPIEVLQARRDGRPQQNLRRQQV